MKPIDDQENLNAGIPPKTKDTEKPNTNKNTSIEPEDSGESAVQDGEDVVDIVNEQDQNKATNTETSQQEFITDVNNISQPKAEALPYPSLDWRMGDDDNEDDDDDDDDDDEPFTEIGDDPGETKKKIPVM